MFLHQGTNVLINSINGVTVVSHLKTMSNLQISGHSIVTLPTRKTGKCTTNTSCIYEVQYSILWLSKNPKPLNTSIYCKITGRYLALYPAKW